MQLALPNFFLNDLLRYSIGLRVAITPFIEKITPALSILFLIIAVVVITIEVVSRLIKPIDGDEDDTGLTTTLIRIGLLGFGLVFYIELADFLLFKPADLIYRMSKVGYDALLTEHIWFKSSRTFSADGSNNMIGAILSVGVFGMIHFVVMMISKLFTSYIIFRGILASNIYYLLGPFTITLALVPRNEQVVKRLYLEGLSVALWPAISTLIMCVIGQLPYYKHDTVQGNALMYGIWTMALECMALFSMFGVSDYANNLVAFSSKIAGRGMGTKLKGWLQGDTGVKGLAKFAIGNTVGRTFNALFYFNGNNFSETFTRREHKTVFGHKVGTNLSMAESVPVKMARSIGRFSRELTSSYSKNERLAMNIERAKNEERSQDESRLFDMANRDVPQNETRDRTILNRRMDMARLAATRAQAMRGDMPSTQAPQSSDTPSTATQASLADSTIADASSDTTQSGFSRGSRGTVGSTNANSQVANQRIDKVTAPNDTQDQLTTSVKFTSDNANVAVEASVAKEGSNEGAVTYSGIEFHRGGQTQSAYSPMMASASVSNIDRKFAQSTAKMDAKDKQKATEQSQANRDKFDKESSQVPQRNLERSASQSNLDAKSKEGKDAQKDTQKETPTSGLSRSAVQKRKELQRSQSFNAKSTGNAYTKQAPKPPLERSTSQGSGLSRSAVQKRENLKRSQSVNGMQQTSRKTTSTSSARKEE